MDTNKKEVKLNSMEQNLCQLIAVNRYKSNRELHVNDRLISGENVIKNEIEGIGGEIAFCKLFNIYPDTEIGSWGSYDCKLPDGITVDVKTTKYDSGHLLAPLWKRYKNPPQYYALMVGVFPNYSFRGFIKSIDFLNDKHIGNMGHGSTYVAKQEELVYEIY